MFKKTLLTIAALTFAAIANLQADIRMPALFTDNMVLQRGVSVPIWGFASEGEKVTVKYQRQSVSAKTKNGRWIVNLKPLRVGKPGDLVIDGRNRIQLKNVVVGEVWICSGQSNMFWPMSKCGEAGETDIANSRNFDLRLFQVEKKKSDKPLADLDMPWNQGKYGWQVSGNQAAYDFSAVAYYFGKKLQADLKVPVGLIHTSWGGSPIEVWMSDTSLRSYQDISDNHILSTGNYRAAQAKYFANLKKYEADVKEGKKGKDDKPLRKPNAPREPWKPSSLYNAMIHPLLPFACKGAIWYQGESNASRAWQYRSLLPDMIKQWRREFGQSDFTFLTVQLAPYDRDHRSENRTIAEITESPEEGTFAELREAQLITAQRDTRGGIAVITDYGDPHDIHPIAKKPVGERLALAARGIAYKEKSLTYSGPIYKAMKYIKNKDSIDKIALRFDHVGKGLTAKDGDLKGFAICGSDKIWKWADVEIVGDTVEVSHADIAKPESVRYGWADYPVCNLFNKDGLPASPFRTDRYKLTTEK
ncbi:MAG: sialate O-acetylesterase [Candidatus Binatia bacterium]|jgi:sialate O-acetylesterase